MLLSILCVVHQHFDWDNVLCVLIVVRHIAAQYIRVIADLDIVFVPTWSQNGRDVVVIEEVVVILIEYGCSLFLIHNAAGSHKTDHIRVLLVHLWHLSHGVLKHGSSLREAKHGHLSSSDVPDQLCNSWHIMH